MQQPVSQVSRWKSTDRCQGAILSSQSSTTPWAVGFSSGAFNGDCKVTLEKFSRENRQRPMMEVFGDFGVFPEMVVPNNHGFSYQKMIILGCLGDTVI